MTDTENFDKLNSLLQMEQELNQAEAELKTKEHTIKGERYVGGETRMVCTCGKKTPPARGKVTAARIVKHEQKTGHRWSPS